MRLEPLRWWQLEGVLAIERARFGAEAWSPALFWSELAQAASRHYLVAVEETAIVGYAGLCAYAHDGYVQTIAVAPGDEGRGVGTALLTALLAEAGRRALPAVGLEVRADNERAQRLYRRFGFAPVGVRKAYYQPSGADAVVMRRTGSAAVPTATRRAGCGPRREPRDRPR